MLADLWEHVSYVQINKYIYIYIYISSGSVIYQTRTISLIYHIIYLYIYIYLSLFDMFDMYHLGVWDHLWYVWDLRWPVASQWLQWLQNPRIEDPSNTQVGWAPWARAGDGIQIHNRGYPAGYPKLAGWLMEKLVKNGMIWLVYPVYPHWCVWKFYIRYTVKNELLYKMRYNA